MLIRLGKVKRRLLLAAAANQPSFTPLPVVRDNATRRITRLRAVWSLLTLGLIEVRVYRAETGAKRRRTERDRLGFVVDVWSEPVKIERVQDFRLSPQGAALVDAYRDELENGRRIRWGRVPMPTPAKLLSTELAHNRRGEDSKYGPYYDRFVIKGPVDHRSGSDLGWPILKDPDKQNLWSTVCDTPEKLARCWAFTQVYDAELAKTEAECRAKLGEEAIGFNHWMAICAVAKDRAKARWANRD